jgi:D-glycero-D-manno-heptose 1,7-bisphosphate phosphatase
VTRRAIFCDRDGTMIRDLGYLRDPAGVEPLPGAAAALADAAARGFALVVVSNQSGVGRGIVSRDQFAAVDRRFRAAFAEHGVMLDGVFYCLHAPDEGCTCRKPKTGLIEEAVRALALDPRRSYLLGDKRSDIAAGRAAGCRTVLFASPDAPEAADSTPAPDATIGSWTEAPGVLL